MKPTLSIIICLIFAATATAKREPVLGGRRPTQDVTSASGMFGIGAERHTVVDLIGLPDHRMGDALWVYYGFKTANDEPRTAGFDAAVIAFERDRVVAIRLTDSSVLRDFIAREKLKVTGPSYADLLR